MDFETAIRDNFARGHFWNPAFPETRNVRQSDLSKLRPDDPVAIQSFQSRCDLQAATYLRAGLQYYGRLPVNDGKLGPAAAAVIDSPADCFVPDYEPPADAEFQFEDPDLQAVCENLQRTAAARGSGNWFGCHGIGNYHCAIVDVDLSNRPDFLGGGVLEAALSNVQKSFDQFGLRFVFRDRNTGDDLLTGDAVPGTANTVLTWVNSSPGWIGLAIVGRGQGCNDQIWLKLLKTYRGGSTRESIINQQTTLIAHELFHNCGGMHQRGGFSNSVIIGGLPLIIPRTDPAARFLADWFGNEPIPTGRPEPEPPGGTLENRIRAVERGLSQNADRDIARDAIVEYLLAEVRDLRRELKR